MVIILSGSENGNKNYATYVKINAKLCQNLETSYFSLFYTLRQLYFPIEIESEKSWSSQSSDEAIISFYVQLDVIFIGVTWSKPCILNTFCTRTVRNRWTMKRDFLYFSHQFLAIFMQKCHDLHLCVSATTRRQVTTL